MSVAISRRNFLVGVGAAGVAAAGGVVVGHFAGWESASPARAEASDSGTGLTPLVVITLYGGNDGLNTLIPYTDPAYQALRPNIGYSPDQVLDLDGQFGLNPQLTQLQSLWKQGHLAVVRGVGYPNPSLSHFESMDIWQTANPGDGSGNGWLGDWLDLSADDPLQAVSIGPTLPLLMRGEKRSATALTGPSVDLPGSTGLQSAFAALGDSGPDRLGLAGAVGRSMSDLLSARSQLDRLHPAAGPAGGSAGKTATATSLSDQLSVVADLINAGAPTQVYQVSLSSFDTHAGEKADQERMFKELDDGIGGFLPAIASSPAGRRTVVMTYSQFGRRPAENASGGTDHGAASVLFVAGPTVAGGQYYGEQPSLTQLDSDGNLVHNVDFRQVYATVLENALGTDAKDVLGSSFKTLAFL